VDVALGDVPFEVLEGELVFERGLVTADLRPELAAPRAGDRRWLLDAPEIGPQGAVPVPCLRDAERARNRERERDAGQQRDP
jgi:hypothetical protein